MSPMLLWWHRAHDQRDEWVRVGLDAASARCCAARRAAHATDSHCISVAMLLELLDRNGCAFELFIRVVGYIRFR